jgi:competence protein ComEC
MHIPWSLSRGKALSIEKPAPFYSQFVSRIHHNAIETLQLRWKKDGDTNLLPAIVIGDKADLTKEQKDAFVKSGTMHLIAVSGMNVMAVAIVLWVLVRLTVLPRVWQAGVVAALLGLYALVAGAGPSVLRAWGLVSLALLAWALKRQRNLFSIIILAATISLIVEPLSFLHAGWRMSFSVVTGVILGMNAVERSQILHRFRGVSRVVIETLIVSAIAGLCVTPMSATYWGVYQPLGFLVNAIAVALASFITILGTLSWLVAWIPGASILINEIAYFFINLIQISIERFLKMPNAYLTLPQIKETGIEVWGTIGILAVFYILARFGWRKGRKMTRKTPPHLKNEPKEIAASSAVQ